MDILIIGAWGVAIFLALIATAITVLILWLLPIPFINNIIATILISILLVGLYAYLFVPVVTGWVGA